MEKLFGGGTFEDQEVQDILTATCPPLPFSMLLSLFFIYLHMGVSLCDSNCHDVLYIGLHHYHLLPKWWSSPNVFS
jgi:hypothetical protein